MTTPAVEEVLAATDVSFRYGSGPLVVEGVDLTVPRGSAIGIVGESGSGKTTVAGLLVGLLHPTSGSVTVEGQPWSAVGRRSTLRMAVQMIFQNPYSALNPRLSALDTVAEVYEYCGGLTRELARERAVQLLARVGIDGVTVTKRAPDLSGGQGQRVGIARALAAEPTVIVADEPTSALDVSVQAQILNLLKDLREEEQLSLVLISHDLTVVSYLTEQAIVMDEGRIIEAGPTQDLLSSPSHQRTRALVDSIL